MYGFNEFSTKYILYRIYMQNCVLSAPLKPNKTKNKNKTKPTSDNQYTVTTPFGIHTTQPVQLKSRLKQVIIHRHCRTFEC